LATVVNQLGDIEGRTGTKVVRMGLAKADLEGSFRRLAGSEVGELLKEVRDYLAEQGVECYLVGGLVRDVVLERGTADVDLCVGQDALEVARRVADRLGGRFVPLDQINRVGRVVLVESGGKALGVQWELDFSTFEGSIELDLGRRDFTIDAMAVDLGRMSGDFSGIELIDPFGGLGDLKRRVVRVVAETAFTSDAVRLLRAVRLAAELGFTIDDKTEALIRGHSHLIAGVAGERVREELLRLMAVPGSGRLSVYLDELGLLTAVFPELAGMKGVEQPREHFWDVFDHSMRVITAVEFLLRQGDWEFAGDEVLSAVPWSDELVRHFNEEVSHGSTRGTLLKLAALFHDVAKPQTKAIDDGGRMRFLGHAQEGASVTAGILERLRFSAKEVKLVEIMVQHHLRPGQMSQDDFPSRRAIYRYFRDTGEAGIDILFLSLADHLATRGPELKQSHWREHVRVVEYVLSRRFEEEGTVRPPKLVDGHDIISIFGISPGPRVGEILEAVREAQAAAEVTSREEALSFIKELLA